MTTTRVRIHYTKYQWWGVPSRYVQLVDHLDPLNFRVSAQGAPDVVEPEGLPDWQRRMLEIVRPEVLRQRRPWHNLNDLASEVSTLDMCRKGKVDIVHFLDGEHSGPLLPHMVRNHLPGVRTVASFHQPPNLLDQVVFGQDLRKLDAVILMAPSQVPYFRQFLPPEQIHVILHGVDTNFFTPNIAPLPKGRLRCITTGLHLRDWDVFHAVAVALPEVDFTVVTSSRVTIAPLPNVKVLVGISDAELAESYRASDVLFLPLKDATANNSILEGMASGLPVVSTDIEAVRSYVPDAAGLLIHANDVSNMVFALKQLAEDPSRRASIGLAARQQAEALSWSNVARQYEKIYAALTAKSRTSAALHEVTATPDVSPKSQRALARSSGNTEASRADAFALGSLAEWSSALHRAGLTAEAAMITETLMSTQPGQSTTFAALARYAEAEWRWLDAADHWGQFLGSCADDGKGEGLRRMALAQAQAGALPLAVKILEKVHGRFFEALLGAAQLEENFGAVDQAFAAWTACLEQYPDRVDGFVGLARHHLRWAQNDAAEELLDHARRVWPNNADLAALWAQSADDSGRPSRIGSSRWGQALAEHRTSLKVMLPYAQHLGRLGDFLACESLLARAEVDQGQKAEVLLRFHIGDDDLAKAADQARRAVCYWPENLEKRRRLAEILLRQGTAFAQSEAVAVLQALRQFAPEATGLLPLLAVGLISIGDDDDADAVIGALPQLRNDALTRMLRFWAKADKGAEAQTYFRELIVGFGYTTPDLS